MNGVTYNGKDIVLTHYTLISNVSITPKGVLISMYIGDERTVVYTGELDTMSTAVVKMVVAHMSKMNFYDDTVMYSYDNLVIIKSKIAEMLTNAERVDAL